ncbi:MULTISPECIES: helix-turn-helix transcriptional regulator [unclassified Sphaerospermopsis]|uniref:helix-turn-helix domain-containing protein n=1 Tax=unclassified Sphaerospermopsis TaxID=2646443 RepID=UPI0016815FA1|nr:MULTISPECIES: helix-turn-helix transcriptional regulator [unclassified Sphaerospermopsis]MBD2131724.1 XRE family transcriptional regulator [Sphaerospermopsis sp. FACHB-1094]MBD2147519.1 XRE family transcriptional regulator [Sphaerospermopsis sp. FACHB-1194]
MSENIEIQTSSGNVFADLGLPNADEMLAKAELARKISQAITARGLTQMEAAELLGIDQPKVSALIRGKLTGFSLERMFRFLNAFGSDVEITVKPKAINCKGEAFGQNINGFSNRLSPECFAPTESTL